MIILFAFNFVLAGTHFKTHLEFKESMQDSIKKETLERKDKKSPNGAMLRSLAIPGWGQFYNDQIIKGLIVTAGQGTLIGFAIYFNNQVNSAESAAANTSDANLKSVYVNEKNFYLDRRNLTFWLMVATVLLSMIDAYIDAHLY